MEWTAVSRQPKQHTNKTKKGTTPMNLSTSQKTKQNKKRVVALLT
jgi:hypothetical protein